ncbi:MAG: hypothetical protein IJT64_05290, partial [Kiritimatiellae bacterium]|nr:hypothetical protein [Kiritimatiellia bacterium]
TPPASVLIAILIVSAMLGLYHTPHPPAQAIFSCGYHAWRSCRACDKMDSVRGGGSKRGCVYDCRYVLGAIVGRQKVVRLIAPEKRPVLRTFGTKCTEYAE